MTTRALRAGRLPLLIAACLICAIGSINLYRLTSATAPRNPWESLQVVEAWRSLQGMPVYELPPEGHATHNYGALVPWVQGQIFRWTGPNNVTGRLLSLVSALSLVTLLAFCFAGERSVWALAIAWAALLGVDHRSGHYFAENRPDMTALFLGAVGRGPLRLGNGTQALASGRSRDGVPRGRVLLQANGLDLLSRAAHRFVHADGGGRLDRRSFWPGFPSS